MWSSCGQEDQVTGGDGSQVDVVTSLIRGDAAAASVIPQPTPQANRHAAVPSAMLQPSNGPTHDTWHAKTLGYGVLLQKCFR